LGALHNKGRDATRKRLLLEAENLQDNRDSGICLLLFRVNIRKKGYGIMLAENMESNHQALTEYGDLLSVDDLKSIFGISKQTIYKGIKDGTFGTPIKIGRAYKIPKIHVLKKYFYIF